MNRRVALGTLAAIGAAATSQTTSNGMIYRILGKTGEKVSAIGLGGYHIRPPPEPDAIRIVRRAIDRGITFMDNCWDYHGGVRERRMGVTLRDCFRHKVVLRGVVEEGIGVLGMELMGGGNILKSGRVTPVECLHYSLNLPTSAVITGCERMEILDQAIEAARTFKPMSSAEVSALLAKTKDVAMSGQFEPSKTTPQFDGTAQNPQWMT